MFLLYFALWIVFTGMVTLESCVFGLVIAAGIFEFCCKFMDYSLEKELRLYRKAFGLIRYVYVLIREIIKANMTVIHLILSEKEEPVPALVHFRSDLKSSVFRVIMADSVTLTPGTITVSLEGSDYVVHCLDESLAPGMADSVFTEMLTELERAPEEKKQA
ncbi:MAG: Na+/H+ antiporter subunit E [Clostridiales bacterium]|nr:Na+/H+ antiporter subunit E [Clostridiales bacterium]